LKPDCLEVGTQHRSLSNVTTPQSSTDYLYDGDDLIAKYQSGAVVRRYIHGDGADEPVASYGNPPSFRWSEK